MRRKLDDGTVVIVGEMGPGRWQSRPGKGAERPKAHRLDGSPWTRPSLHARAARRHGAARHRAATRPRRPIGALILGQRRYVDAAMAQIDREIREAA